ncbi:MAG: OmpA family protein [Actinomycetaceae bacterium]|nr:OmpA family protein [Actinomycetaceae bacterium]
MPKKALALLLALPLTFSLSACSDSTSGSEDSSTTQPVTTDDAMVVPGYQLGEIPAIPVYETVSVPSLIEAPDAKITVNQTESLRSVPGITVTPVRLENGEIVDNGMAAYNVGGSDGVSGYSNDDSGVDVSNVGGEDGVNSYIDDLDGIDISNVGGENGVNNYSDEKNQVYISRVGDKNNGVHSYDDEKNGIHISHTGGEDGVHTYIDDVKEIELSKAGDVITYVNKKTEETITITGSQATYDNSKTGLSIVNDGNGKALVTLDDKTKTVDAEPYQTDFTIPEVPDVPKTPTVEANALKITMSSEVLFDFDKYNIRSDAQTVLNDLAKVLKDAGISSFTIEGHTDSVSSEDYNQTLSENRANSVKDYLEKQGVNASITTEGYGESRPVATNDTAAGRQQNRRVEFLIPVQ